MDAGKTAACKMISDAGGTDTSFTVNCPVRGFVQLSQSRQQRLRKNGRLHGKPSAESTLTSVINAGDGSLMPYTMRMFLSAWSVHHMKMNRNTAKTAESG